MITVYRHSVHSSRTVNEPILYGYQVTTSTRWARDLVATWPREENLSRTRIRRRVRASGVCVWRQMMGGICRKLACPTRGLPVITLPTVQKKYWPGPESQAKDKGSKDKTKMDKVE